MTQTGNARTIVHSVSRVSQVVGLIGSAISSYLEAQASMDRYR